MKFALYMRDDQHSHEVGKVIRKHLENTQWSEDLKNPDLVICVGGDGTILRAIHTYIHRLNHTAFVGVHTGTLGFFTDYTESDIPILLEDMISRQYECEDFPLIEVAVAGQRERYYALNEIRLGNFSKTVSYDLTIDGEFFERTQGSGLCICTQAGATGANRSLNGAVVDTGLDILQMVEIMPVSHCGHHSLRNPYIMRSDRVIGIEGESLKDSTLCYDHKEIQLESDADLTVRTSALKVRFARFRPYSYLKRLRSLY